MRVLTWNLAARRDCAAQVAALAALAPDVVALQEVTVATWLRLRPLLADAGFVNAFAGSELVAEAAPLRVGRFAAAASRWPLTPGRQPAVPAPETVASVVVDSPSGSFELLSVYMPNATKEPPLKIETQEGLALRLAPPHARPYIVCGDFNSPLAETTDGETIPWARTPRGRAAELAMHTGMADVGLLDVYRTLNGFEASDASWFWTRLDGRTGGYRLDHIFASPSLNPTACKYVHQFRESRLSDHSAVVADFAPGAP